MAVTAPHVRPDGVPFAAGLDAHADAPALWADGAPISYAELATTVRDAARRLGGGRRLVAIAMGNDLPSVVAHLAVLSAGHVGLLVDATRPHDVDRLVEVYDPDVVAAGDPDTWVVRHDAPAHDLHPDLALLLSTSGSTGAAKLVRLSRENLQSNAEAIAHYLGTTSADRAITSLPLHYCYGLSVLHSHLAVGASVALTDLSVVDPCFWDLARRCGTTTLAGVPHTFELLDRVGVDRLASLPLRVVTQAGGRMEPDRVRRFARLGTEQGWDLFVMYGQTEATARMAYLPPHLAAARPTAVGVPIPGGHIDIAPVADVAEPDVGELVYRGPNVMLGYATCPADLALGRTVDALRTGDLARRAPDGLVEIVGRRSRFLKLYGLRIDLGEIERRLADDGVPAVCSGDDERVAVAVERRHRVDVGALRATVRTVTGLPDAALAIVEVDEVPRLASGKPDAAAIRELAVSADDGRPAPSADAADPVARTFVEVLGVAAPDDDDTFVGLGGDSLSYVEASIRLESTLGPLPSDWHLRTVSELRGLAPERRSGFARVVAWVETGVVLRAVAIATIVTTHVGVTEVRGGAHVLLAVAGANFARFQGVSGQVWRSLARIAVPSAIWIAGLVLLADAPLRSLAFANVLVGDVDVHAEWRLWFVEVLVLLLAAAGLLLSIPRVRRLDARLPRVLPGGLLALAVVPVLDTDAAIAVDRHLARPHLVAWLFLLGWAATRARGPWERVALTGVAVALVPGFFGHPARDAVVFGGLAALVWVPAVPLPRPLVRPLGTLAATSLYIYLTHWQVYPWVLERSGPTSAVAASLVVGVAVGWAALAAVTRFERWADRTVRCGHDREAGTRRLGGPRGQGAQGARPRRAGLADA